MKKGIILMFALILLTGCGKKEMLKCSYQNKHDGVEFVTTIEAEVKEDKIVDAKATMKYEDESLAKTMCDILNKADDSNNTLKCDGKTITIKDYQKSISEKEMTKEQFLEYMKNQKYTCE